MASIKRQKQWGRNETLALLEIMKNYYKALNTAKSPSQKAKIWQNIREQFDTLYPDRSEKAIRKRYLRYNVLRLHCFSIKILSNILLIGGRSFWQNIRKCKTIIGKRVQREWSLNIKRKFRI